jgi:hypothetical protein
MMFYPIDVWFEEENHQNYIRFGDLDHKDILDSAVFRWAMHDDFQSPYNPNYYHVVLLF